MVKLNGKSQQWAINKNNVLIMKIIVPFLIMGFAYFLLISDSMAVSQIEKVIVEDEAQVPEMTEVDVINYRIPSKEKCDLFSGDWIPNPSGPIYTNVTCHLIENHQNCMKNGRPDSGYLYWKWSLRECELPRFDAGKFLELMRNKRWALIGDSISRNHVQSLLCMLSTVEKAVEVYHSKDFKTKIWVFPLYNFTVLNIWSPYLLKADIFEDIDGNSSSDVELHLDKLDKTWTDLYQSLDYMIISSGKWFVKTAIYYENNTPIGCHYCTGKNLTEIGFDYAYNMTLTKMLDFITTSNHKGLIFFRTSTPDHFEGGEWSDGGGCNRTAPVKHGEMKLKWFNTVLRKIEVEQFEKGAKKASKGGVNLKFLDFTPLSLMRPDGHPGPYRHFYPFAKGNKEKVQNDCLHWCLPGPMDAWNDVIMKMVVNS